MLQTQSAPDSQSTHDLSGDAAITADREETKYMVESDQRATLSRIFSEHLTVHHFRGEGDNPLPSPEHYVTTVYFDTPSRRHLTLARNSADDNVKLRAKEYYDVHPSLAELATDVSEVMHQPPWLWLELKRRTGTRSSKHRIRLERTAIPAWLSGKPAAASSQVAGNDGDAEQIRAYCASLAEPLSACCLVNYRRISWQTPDSSLRVTLDSELAFYPAPRNVWFKPSLVRNLLGAPSAREPYILIEVKRRENALPTWLDQALKATRAKPLAYSKFLQASESVEIDG